ncbi:MAG: hypothetical protein LC664_02055 [Flavobacteriales bacterium]|nr:hypothetical protein [Flavobacteriales bacterium]
MRKLLALSLLFSVVLNNIQAQSFYWGYPFLGEDETGKTVSHVVDEDIYRIASHYDLDIFNYRIAADAFSGDELERTSEHEFETDADRGPQHSLHVDNNGNVFVVKRFDLKKQKPYHAIYAWKRNAQSLEVHSLKQDDNYQIAQIYPHFRGEKFYLAALLTSDGSTTFSLKVDMSGRHSGTLGSALVMLEFSPKGELVYTVRNEFERPISNLSIKDILSNNGNLWVIMQRMQIDERSSGQEMASGNTPKNYTYLSNGFAVSLVSAETGKVKWTKQIETDEPNTKNDNGSFLSVLPFLQGDNLVLLYNETRDLRSGAVRNPLLKRFPIMEHVSPAGETVEKKAFTNAGVGVEEDEIFDLDTSHIVKVSDGKYLIRARGRGEYKYGYLQM